MAEPSKPPPPDSRDLDTALSAHAGRIAGLYAQSSAARWGVSPDSFRAALGRCLAKALPGAPDVSIVARVLDTLHMEDLVLSCACAEGQEAAWEHFVATYRGYLRSAAQVIVGSAGGSLESFDLADSLFADLYGVAEGKPGH